MIIPEAYYRDTHLRPGEPNTNARRHRLDTRAPDRKFDSRVLAWRDL
jgi:hypothetical protein